MLLLTSDRYELLGPAVSIEQAIELIDALRPDCATLDYQLCDGTAGAVANRLTQLNIPFVLCSGNILSAGRDLQVLPSAVVAKPFAGAELRDAVAHVLTSQLSKA